jgi:serine phosphatase RsbU (regulator of sigma subunit)
VTLTATPPPPAKARAFAPERLERYRDALLHKWCGTAAMLGAVFMPLFLLLDWFMLPAATFERFLRYRAAVTGVLALQLLLIRTTRPSRLSFLHGYFFTLLVGGAISWMTVELGGFDSPYYAGLNLVIATNLFLPWRPLHAALTSLSTALVYLVLGVVYGGPFHAAALANNLFFIGVTLIISVVTARAKYQLIEDEWAARTGLLVANAKLEKSRTELKAARDALWGEMEVAQRIQTALLPEDGWVGDYQVAARMVPAAEVGGDYYDILDPPGGCPWLAIGDVSGHGVESGLVMMMVQTGILALVREDPGRTPAEVFCLVNGLLWQNVSRMRSSRYMTLNVIRLEGDGFTMAGKHQDVLVWRQGRGVEVVENRGTWIGLVPDIGGQVEDLRVPMGPGDVALFFTDGATEATGKGGDLYGEERLVAALARVAELPLHEALTSILAGIAGFRGGDQGDDVTLLLLKRPEPHVPRPIRTR